MVWDPIRFLEQHRIPYVTSGPNTGKGWHSIQCPWCGASDHSQHLGIRVEGAGVGAFHCWRVPSHSGRSPVRLVAKLLNVSSARARQIVGVGTTADLSVLERKVALLQGTDLAYTDPEPLAYPREFTPVKNAGLGKVAWNYLEIERGYGRHTADLIRMFDLRYAYSGRWERRVVVPIKYQEELVAWTARAVDRTTDLRYMTLSDDPAKAEERGDAVAKMSIKQTLFNFDRAYGGGRSLIICEGPFDAMRVQLFSNQYDIVATCLYTINVSAVQANLLRVLRPKFQKFILLLDEGTALQQLQIKKQLADLQLQVCNVPRGYKDPGEMPRKAIESCAIHEWLSIRFGK